MDIYPGVPYFVSRYKHLDQKMEEVQPASSILEARTMTIAEGILNNITELDQNPPPRPTKRSRTAKDDRPLEPMEDILFRRVTTIKEGDNVLLRLPSDSVKAVVASKDGYVVLTHAASASRLFTDTFDQLDPIRQIRSIPCFTTLRAAL